MSLSNLLQPNSYEIYSRSGHIQDMQVTTVNGNVFINGQTGSTGLIGPTGPTGSIGATGAIGATGIGPSTIFLIQDLILTSGTTGGQSIGRTSNGNPLGGTAGNSQYYFRVPRDTTLRNFFVSLGANGSSTTQAGQIFTYTVFTAPPSTDPSSTAPFFSISPLTVSLDPLPGSGTAPFFRSSSDIVNSVQVLQGGYFGFNWRCSSTCNLTAQSTTALSLELI